MPRTKKTAAPALEGYCTRCHTHVTATAGVIGFHQRTDLGVPVRCAASGAAAADFFKEGPCPFKHDPPPATTMTTMVELTRNGPVKAPPSLVPAKVTKVNKKVGKAPAAASTGPEEPSEAPKRPRPRRKAPGHAGTPSGNDPGPVPPAEPPFPKPVLAPELPPPAGSGAGGGLAAKLAGVPGLRPAAGSCPAVSPPHVVVTARAGTGKTFTLIVGVLNMFRDRVPGLWEELGRRLGFDPAPSPQQAAVWEQMRAGAAGVRTVKFAAFNRSVVQEFNHKWGWACPLLKAAGVSLEFSTNHSMGCSAVTRALGRLPVNEYRVTDLIAAELDTSPKELRERKPVLLSAARELVSLCKVNLTGLGVRWPTTDAHTVTVTDDDLDALARHYDVELSEKEGYGRKGRCWREEVFAVVPRVLARCLNPQADGCIDYDDMVWLPAALGLPVFRNDLLLVDECQDLNRAQQALARAAGRRLVLCGDPRQAIYGFAGADVNSMERMAEELGAKGFSCPRCFGARKWMASCKACGGIGRVGINCVSLPLTVTRRCGKAIVQEANKVVRDFEAHAGNPEGVIREAAWPLRPDGTERPEAETYLPLVKEGDFLLCRVNAPLVGECFRFIKRGRKANILGRDVAAGLTKTVGKLCEPSDPVETLIGRLEGWLRQEEAKERARRNPSEARLIALRDRADCLNIFASGCAAVSGVIAKIASVFTDDPAAPGVRLSSIHKAKGLEAGRVFFLMPPKGGCPHPMAKTAWQQEQEMNLLYVGITRAINELVFVR